MPVGLVKANGRSLDGFFRHFCSGINAGCKEPKLEHEIELSDFLRNLRRDVTRDAVLSLATKSCWATRPRARSFASSGHAAEPVGMFPTRGRKDHATFVPPSTGFYTKVIPHHELTEPGQPSKAVHRQSRWHGGESPAERGAYRHGG